MTLDELRSHKMQIDSFVSTYGIKNIRVFGSTALGSAREQSDVDFLVQLPEHHSVFDHMRLQDTLSQILAVPVELVNEQCLDSYIAPYILKEAVKL